MFFEAAPLDVTVAAAVVSGTEIPAAPLGFRLTLSRNLLFRGAFSFLAKPVDPFLTSQVIPLKIFGRY